MAAGQQRLNCFFCFIVLSPFFTNTPREQQRVKQLRGLLPLSRRHIPVPNARKSSRRLLAAFCWQRILHPRHAARSQPDGCVFLPCAWRLSAAARVCCMSCFRLCLCHATELPRTAQSDIHNTITHHKPASHFIRIPCTCHRIAAVKALSPNPLLFPPSRLIEEKTKQGGG